MTAAWSFDACTCEWSRYSAKCHKPTHVAFALRETPDPRLPLILTAPVGDFIPAWMLEAEAS